MLTLHGCLFGLDDNSKRYWWRALSAYSIVTIKYPEIPAKLALSIQVYLRTLHVHSDLLHVHSDHNDQDFW
jgi:hypothetical protein